MRIRICGSKLNSKRTSANAPSLFLRCTTAEIKIYTIQEDLIYCIILLCLHPYGFTHTHNIHVYQFIANYIYIYTPIDCYIGNFTRIE